MSILNFWLTPENTLLKVKDHYAFIKKYFKSNTEKKEKLFDYISKLGYIRAVVCTDRKEMLICFNSNMVLNYKKMKALKDYCIENNLNLFQEKDTSTESVIKMINIEI